LLEQINNQFDLVFGITDFPVFTVVILMFMLPMFVIISRFFFDITDNGGTSDKSNFSLTDLYHKWNKKKFRKNK